MRRTLVATAMLLALVATACGGASETTDTPAEPETTTTAPAETTTTQPAPEAVTVEVLDNNTFEPSEITINVGEFKGAVIWGTDHRDLHARCHLQRARYLYLHLRCPRCARHDRHDHREPVTPGPGGGLRARRKIGWVRGPA